MSFSIFVLIAICVLFVMYLTIFWLIQKQKPSRLKSLWIYSVLIRKRKLIFGVTLVIIASLVSLIAYFIAIVPLPAISEDEAVSIAIKGLETQFQNSGIKDEISEMNWPKLTLWFDQNGNELLLYHVHFVVESRYHTRAGINVTVNAQTGETYDVKNNPINRNTAINGDYDYFINRVKNVALKIKLKANHMMTRLSAAIN